MQHLPKDLIGEIYSFDPRSSLPRVSKSFSSALQERMKWERKLQAETGTRLLLEGKGSYKEKYERMMDIYRIIRKRFDRDTREEDDKKLQEAYKYIAQSQSLHNILQWRMIVRDLRKFSWGIGEYISADLLDEYIQRILNSETDEDIRLPKEVELDVLITGIYKQDNDEIIKVLSSRIEYQNIVKRWVGIVILEESELWQIIRPDLEETEDFKEIGDTVRRWIDDSLSQKQDLWTSVKTEIAEHDLTGKPLEFLEELRNTLKRLETFMRKVLIVSEDR